MAATQKRTLHTGETLWQSRRYHALRVSEFPPLDADVVIVGAGVSGALLAEWLTTHGCSVAVLDRRGVCQGSTAASTALILFEIDTPLQKLSRRVGRADAVRAWHRSLAGVASLARRIRQLRISCDLRSRCSVLLPGNEMTSADLRSEAELRQRCGLPSRFLDRQELGRRLGIHKAGAICSAGSLELDPVKLAAGLLRRAIDGGAVLAAPVEVVGARSSRNGVIVSTSDGRPISCRHLVYATGYELPKSLPKRGLKIVSTWSLATAPQPDLLWRTRDLIWEAADPYLYIRTTPDGRIVAGGEDEEVSDETARDAMTARKIKAIRAKLRALLPNVDTCPEFAWSGNFGDSASGLPRIGRMPGERRIFAIAGAGGNGITFSAVAAQIVGSAILGRPDPDADLFGED